MATGSRPEILIFYLNLFLELKFSRDDEVDIARPSTILKKYLIWSKHPLLNLLNKHI